MKKRNRILLAVVVVAVLGGLAWVVLREPPEPVYQGRTLTEWLLQYAQNTYVPLNTDAPALASESKAAILQIGTNALPTLLKLAAAHDSPFKIKVNAWIRRLVPNKRLFTSDEINILGVTGFDLLGPRGNDAVPSLVVLLKSRHSNVRYAAIVSLGFIGPPAKAAVPQPIKFLNDQELRRNTIETLGKIGENAKPAVPALLQCLNDNNDYVRLAAKNALKRIDPVAASKAGVK